MMDVQAAPPTYTPVGGQRPPSGNPPVLGQQVPGMSGGLPAQGGLSVLSNPMSQQLQSRMRPEMTPSAPSAPVAPGQAAQQTQQYGRGEDTMLVHMTPDEVNSLQGLAMASGGSLTINPHTGLPEAGWLGKLLPTILGVAGAAFGIPTWAIGLGVGAGQTALTGDLGKGLTAGLQAFGGAGLGQAAGLGGSISNNALGLLGDKAAGQAATSAVGQTMQPALSAAKANLASQVSGQPVLDAIAKQAAAPQAALGAATKAPGFLSRFGSETSLGLKGLPGKALPALAGSAVLSGVSDAFQPNLPKYEPEKTKPYVRMAPAKREVRYPTLEELERLGSAEFNYFTPSNPEPVPASQMGYADGGSVDDGEAGLNALIASYQAQSPGAITASMRPNPLPAPVQPAAPAPTTASTTAPSQTGGETQYNFNRTPMGSGAGTGTGSGINIPGIGNISLPDFSQFAAARPGAPADTGLGSYTATPSQTGKEQSYNFNRGPMSADIPVSSVEDLYDFNFGYADGGAVDMRDGSFVVDARTVSELGNGSSNAGMDLLSRMGGRPVRGPGDGVSDSVKASIGGKQEARVARDEVIFPPEAVRRMGGGSEKRGTQKLYAMMDKAHSARKKAKRGQDTGLRRGLA